MVTESSRSTAAIMCSSTSGTPIRRMMLAKKPRMLVAIALANKMARGVWAMMTKNEDYRGAEMA